MSNYWQQRAVEQSARVHAATEETVKKLEKEIDRATRKVNDKIRSWYTRIAQNNEISYSDAKKLLKKDELEEFKWNVDEYIKIASDESLSKEWAKELENASAKAHITHLDQIKLEMKAELERAYKAVEEQGGEALEKATEDSYLRTAFDYQKGLGVGWSFEAIDSNRLKTLLNSPWPSDGRNFSDRIWTNKSALIRTLEQELTQATLRGDTLQSMTDRVSKKLGVEKKKVSRLIHTETTYMNSLAAKESYKELGVDKVEILATLDKRTCETCADMDGIAINRSEMQPGVNAPPWHPNCRCTVAPWSEFLSKDKGAKRIARNEDDELYEVPADMKYGDWKNGFVDGKPPEDIARVDPVGPTPAELSIPNNIDEDIKKTIRMEPAMFPGSFTATAAEKKNTSALCEYINEKRPDADPKVLELYSKIGKLESVESEGIPLKIGHGAHSGVVSSKINRVNGNLVEVDIKYPKLTGDDFTGQAQTTLHELMHLIDLFCRKNKKKSDAWFSSGNQKLRSFFSNQHNPRQIKELSEFKMSDEVKSLFKDFADEIDQIHKTVTDEFYATAEKLRNQYFAEEITYNEYKKGRRKAETLRNSLVEYRIRNALGGGVDALSDIYDAISGGRFRDVHYANIRYGHGSKYYFMIDSRCQEALANYCALSVSRPDLIELLRVDYPELCDIMSDMVDDMVKLAGD